ncbi:LacI family DNA-binding transcriptional regulator [Streptomyces sp. NPDC059785]|uniref:LacI family DNA-binding transcriptional regulator n=1 Tax=Streptomyces sp. NPDC059785 TaxID=3346945 RepID=UPI003649C018
MKRRVGMADVAREAGVSLGTVSNVLNRPHLVAPSTHARIQAVIDRLGYVRSEQARGLRGGTSRLVAVLVPDLANPFYSALVRGAEERIRGAGLGVLVCNSARDAAEELRLLGMLTEHQVRGAVLAPTDPGGAAVDALRRNGVPLVLADHRAAAEDACSVAVDDVLGGYLAARHLLGSGHRTFVHVTGPASLRQVRERRAGIARAFTEARVPLHGVRDLGCPELTVAAGRDAGGRLLGMPGRPTAVFCANDLLALGLMQTVYEAGLRVPRNLAVVGYDDIDHAASAVVPLTSVRRPAAAMGATAAARLLAETTGELAGHRHEQTLLEPELVVRASTGSPCGP